MRNIFRNKKDEFENFLEEFSESRSNPDRSFEEGLKKKFLIAVDKDSHANLDIRSMIMFRARVMMGGIAVFGLILFTLFVGIQIIPDNSILDKEAIFQKIEAANVPQLSQSALKSLETYNPNLLFPNSEYNFLHVTKNVQQGEKYEECIKIGNFPPYATKYETYQHFVQMPIARYKNVGFDEKGNIIYLSINDGTRIIEYSGGEFAVEDEFISELPEEIKNSEPISSPVKTSSSSDIYNFFPSDAILEEKDGNYIISWTTRMACSSESGENIIHKIITNKDSFKILSEEYYANEVSSENLIFTVEQEVEMAHYEADEVKDIFNFDLNVPIKSRDIIPPQEFDSIEKFQERMLKGITYSAELLAKQPELLLIPDSEGLQPYSTSATDPANISMTSPTGLFPYNDRTFYSDGKIGEYMYKEYLEKSGQSSDLQIPIIQIHFLKKSKYDGNNPPPENFVGMGNQVDMMIYAKGLDIDEFVKTLKVGSYEPFKEKEIDLQIDNQKVKASVYKTGFTVQNILNPGEVSEVDPNAEETYVIFEHNDYLYVIHSLIFLNLEDLKYDTADLTGDEMKNFILNLEGNRLM